MGSREVGGGFSGCDGAWYGDQTLLLLVVTPPSTLIDILISADHYNAQETIVAKYKTLGCKPDGLYLSVGDLCGSRVKAEETLHRTLLGNLELN